LRKQDIAYFSTIELHENHLSSHNAWQAFEEKPSWESSETSSSTKGMVNVKTKQSFIGMASTLDNSWSLEAAHTHLQKFLELELQINQGYFY